MEESGIGAVILEFVKQFGWGVFALLFVVYQIIGHWDTVQNFFREKDKIKHDEREQLSEDTQKLIDNLQGDADRQRRWRIEEGERSDRLVASLRADLSSQQRTIEMIEAGNSRLRHTLNNLAQYTSGVVYKARKAGIEISDFRLDELMNKDPEYAERLRILLGGGS